MKRDDILAGIGMVALAGLCGLGVYGAAVEEVELDNYKKTKLMELRRRIPAASVDNRNFSISDKYQAEKILSYYEDKLRKSVTKAAASNVYCELDTMIQKFTDFRRERALLALYQATDKMDAEIAAERKREEEARHHEQIRQQRETAELLAKALAGKYDR